MEILEEICWEKLAQGLASSDLDLKP
jgi:hypothetical protein